MGELQTLLGVLVVGCSGWTFVKSHHDVGTDGAFNVNDFFGREEVFAAVNM